MGVFGAFFGSKNVFSVFGFKMAQLAKKMEKIEKKKHFWGPKSPKKSEKKILGPKNFFFDFWHQNGSIREKNAKNPKKIFFFDFSLLEVTPAGVIEFFGRKNQKKNFAFFFAN